MANEPLVTETTSTRQTHIEDPKEAIERLIAFGQCGSAQAWPITFPDLLSDASEPGSLIKQIVSLGLKEATTLVEKAIDRHMSLASSTRSRFDALMAEISKAAGDSNWERVKIGCAILRISGLLSDASRLVAAAEEMLALVAISQKRLAEAVSHGETVAEILVSIDDHSGAAKAIQNLAVLLYQAGDDDSALTVLRRWIFILKESNRAVQIAELASLGAKLATKKATAVAALFRNEASKSFSALRQRVDEHQMTVVRLLKGLSEAKNDDDVKQVFEKSKDRLTHEIVKNLIHAWESCGPFDAPGRLKSFCELAAESLKNASLLFDLSLSEGRIAKGGGDLSSALNIYREVALAAEQTGNWEISALAHTFSGGVLRDMGRCEEAITEHQQAIALAEKLPEGVARQYTIGKSLFRIGRAHRTLSSTTTALDYLDKAWLHAEASGDVTLIGDVATSAATWCEEDEQYRKSIDWYLRLLSAWDRATEHSKSERARVLNEIGLNHFRLDQLADAQSYFHSSMELACTVRNIAIQADTVGNLGLVEFRLRHYEQAVKLHEECHRLNAHLGRSKGVAQAMANWAIHKCINYDTSLTAKGP